MYEALHAFFANRGYLQVETPVLVPAPGMEPHIEPFATCLDLSEAGGGMERLWLATSPEYAMKRLVAAGLQRIYQVCKAFRAEPPSHTHNPEFTLLEFYREGDMHGVMEDLEALVVALARAFGHDGHLPGGVSLATPFERLRVRDAFRTEVGVDLAELPEGDGAALAAAIEAAVGRRYAGSWEEVFFAAFLDLVEPTLGRARPTFLTEWPAELAALARLRSEDPRWAERFELYIGGLELANGFSELTDAAEQRRRLEQEREERVRLGRARLPLDEAFLHAVGRMPPTGGVAVGLDRLLMCLVGAASIGEVLLFPFEAPP